MKKYFFLFLIISLIAVGCSTEKSPVGINADSSNDIRGGEATIAGRGSITYDIEFTGVDSSSSEFTTFTYHVISNPDGGPAISHWVIEFAECGGADIIYSSNDPAVEWTHPDPTTGIYGVKFDTGYDDQEERDVTLTLNGHWYVGEVQIAVKSGNGFVLGSVLGPICDGNGGGNNGGGDPDPVYNISGVVFYDVNENGVQDAGEPGIEGVDVTLNDGTVVYTDIDGYYLFTDLFAGDYVVIVGEYNDRAHTTPSVVDVTIVDSDMVVDFGFEPYHVSGVVFYDVNGNGTQDVDEPGLEGVEVVLSDGSTVFTGADGGYYFGGLLPGDYTVTVDELDGFTATTLTSVDLTIVDSDPVVDFGFALDFNSLCGQVADGFTIGYWKTNIQKALQGKTKGTQVSAATLNDYMSEISTFALYPFSFTNLQNAFDVLSSNSSNPVDLLSKQLIGSEFNLMNGAFIGGNELVTWAFLYYGEYVIVHAGEFSDSQILEAKDWYDAYNNSHGGAFFGPGCE